MSSSPASEKTQWRALSRRDVLEELGHLRHDGNVHHLAKAADALFKQGKFQFAEHLAQLALDRSQGSCDSAWLVLANLAAARGEPNRAIHPLLQLTRTSQALVAYKGLARISSWQGNLCRASRLLTLAAARHNNDPRFSLVLAQHWQERGEHRLAWEAFQRCLAVDDSCEEAWLGLLACAKALEQPQAALTIASHLCQLDPVNPSHQQAQALLHWQLDQPEACCDAFHRAWTLAPDNLAYYLNASIPVWRIPANGGTAHKVGCKARAVSRQLIHSLKAGDTRHLDGNSCLLPLVYHCAYSPLNLRAILEPYFAMLSATSAAWLESCIEQSESQYSRSGRWGARPLETGAVRKIRLGMISASFHAHSNATAFGGLLRSLDRSRFELILIHRKAPIVDAIQLQLNGMADVVVYLDHSLEFTNYLLRSQELDILFFTDLGFDPHDFLIPNLRTCSNQITGWGVPHTSGLTSIDVYLSSSWLEGPEHQAEYTEQLVLLDGLPGCVSSEELLYRSLGRDYFLLPDDRLLIGCVQTFWKIHPDFDLILERLAQRLPEALFVFVDCGVDTANHLFQQRLGRRAPKASQQTVFLARCATCDFLALCNCLDLLLDTPYYSAGVTAYLSMAVGTPTVSFCGQRLRDRTVAAIYRYLGIDHAPVAESIPEYVEHVIALAGDPKRRLAIKRQTVERSHRLYDGSLYVRSFERFCEDLLCS